LVACVSIVRSGSHTCATRRCNRRISGAVGVRAVEQVAQQHLTRLLALDLAGVDAVDHEHHRQPLSYQT
jgi:hypothetical protein